MSTKTKSIDERARECVDAMEALRAFCVLRGEPFNERRDIIEPHVRIAIRKAVDADRRRRMP